MLASLLMSYDKMTTQTLLRCSLMSRYSYATVSLTAHMLNEPPNQLYTTTSAYPPTKCTFTCIMMEHFVL